MSLTFGGGLCCDKITLRPKLLDVCRCDSKSSTKPFLSDSTQVQCCSSSAKSRRRLASSLSSLATRCKMTSTRLLGMPTCCFTFLSCRTDSGRYRSSICGIPSKNNTGRRSKSSREIWFFIFSLRASYSACGVCDIAASVPEEDTSQSTAHSCEAAWKCLPWRANGHLSTELKYFEIADKNSLSASIYGFTCRTRQHGEPGTENASQATIRVTSTNQHGAFNCDSSPSPSPTKPNQPCTNHVTPKHTTQQSPPTHQQLIVQISNDARTCSDVAYYSTARRRSSYCTASQET